MAAIAGTVSSNLPCSKGGLRLPLGGFRFGGGLRGRVRNGGFESAIVQSVIEGVRIVVRQLSVAHGG
jgi:hypothetical protein